MESMLKHMSPSLFPFIFLFITSMAAINEATGGIMIHIAEICTLHL
jgi:hypothetical protein